ncbi:L-ascorbate metabolism protein UlaG (beta-lactamase superfamily) [Bradyrhizobium sp. LM6.9]
MPISITLIGGPTALIEIDGFRLLTDPTFDDANTAYQLPACEAGEDNRPCAQA